MQIRERTLNIFDNFYAAPMNLQVFVWDSPSLGKNPSLKIMKKPKFEVPEKSGFLFCLFWTKKFNN